MSTRRGVSQDTPVRDCPDRNIGLVLPAPISDRVDELVALAESAGDRTNRRELIAALILVAAARGDELAKALRQYRRSTVRDALVVRKKLSGPVQFSTHRPGPRPRRSR